MADIGSTTTPTAFYIKVDPTDNVAIVNDRGLTAGTRFPDGLTSSSIPQGHKVAPGYPRPW